MNCRILIALAVAIAAWGCATTPEPSGYVRGPAETAEFYLKSFYRTRMTKDLYQCLAPAVRNQLSYREFLALREREVITADVEGGSYGVRVQAAVLNGYRASEIHRVLYLLQQVHYPYTPGRRDLYRVVRLHVVNERGRWYVEPFVDARTQTVRLLPALKRDALRRLYDQREEIARVISDDIEAMRLGRLDPTEEVATGTKPLTIPDLAGDLRPIPEARGADPQEKLHALIEVGKLHCRTGQLDLAEAALMDALVLDPLNATAKEYLERVRQTRELQREKREMIELIERMLEAEGKPRAE